MGRKPFEGCFQSVIDESACHADVGALSAAEAGVDKPPASILHCKDFSMHSLTIDIIGAGFVGQATGKGFLAKGDQVRFVDIDEAKVARLRQQNLPAFTPQAAAALEGPDIAMLTVNTPTRDNAIDLTWIRTAARDLGVRLRQQHKYQVIVVRSTVVPGTTEQLMHVIEEASGKQAGKDFGVCTNPEFLREQTAENDFAHPWLIVIGEGDTRAGDVVARLYADFECPVHRVTIREAEFQKYVHNVFNAIKITFFNEMREIAHATGVDAERIFPLVAKSAEGIWNPMYGLRDLGPFDGSCLPKDTQAFLSWARQHDQRAPLLAAAIAFNNRLIDRAPAVPALPLDKSAESKRAPYAIDAIVS